MQQMYTPVPNVFFDAYLSSLNQSELKVALVIIRKTLGWRDPKNKKKRKERDRITISQIEKLTGLSNKSIADAITSLINKDIIEAQNYKGGVLNTPEQRRGNKYIFYGCSPKLMKKASQTSEDSQEQMNNLQITKETVTKRNMTKEFEKMKDELRSASSFDELMAYYDIAKVIDGRLIINRDKTKEYQRWQTAQRELDQEQLQTTKRCLANDKRIC